MTPTSVSFPFHVSSLAKGSGPFNCLIVVGLLFFFALCNPLVGYKAEVPVYIYMGEWVFFVCYMHSVAYNLSSRVVVCKGDGITLKCFMVFPFLFSFV